MNKLHYIAFIILLNVFVNYPLEAQTLDEIIQKNIEARGGAENWSRVQTLKIEGTYTSFSAPTPFTIWRKRPDLYRFDSNRISKDLTICYDGQKAWWSNPLFGPKFAKPNRISTPDSMMVLRDKMFDSVFWDYQQKGHEIEFTGKEMVDGNEHFKLKVMLQDSTMEFWYIDCNTFLETKMEGKTYDFTRPVDLKAYFNDYRKVEGILLPYFVEQEFIERYRIFELENVEINQAIDDTIFVMPKSGAVSDK